MMKIKVEFKDLASGFEHEVEMEGPEMDTEDLEFLVSESLKDIYGDIWPEGFEFKISEIASGTIH
jgi:hypothetical protein